MAKGYWVVFYRSISDSAAFAEYAKASVPVIERGGGRFLARTVATKGYEGGLKERVVVIEFDSVAKAIATVESDEYQAAKNLLEGAVDREIRIVEGV